MFDLEKETSRHNKLMATELQRISSKLQEMGANKIILFGSYARGQAGLCSDLDIFVVMHTDLPFIERTAHIYQQISPRTATDILVYTPEEWQQMQNRPFIQEALKEAIVLYEKTPS
ncbi:nucleotidyltransferase domain-containing protein [Desulfurispora thermophila]|uniref:nucleotidyltransferase domain-containing protein n=1 Tax=Desulfurispora thermophila TaxID=265470 RepID=UPI0003749643|nr:nucleotidyltransferase domain-containing protein [Desulfurispora thermophila]